MTFNCALGNHAGSVWFDDKRADDMNAVSKSRSGIEVSIRRLDDLDTGSEEIALLKIDVEGYEKFVLEGGQNVLSRCRTVLLESFREHSLDFGYTTSDLVAILEDMGFRCLRYVDEGRLTAISKGYCSEVCENLIATRDVVSLMDRTGLVLVHS